MLLLTNDSPWMVPLLIFMAELCVVTLGTLRIIFVSRGMKVLAPLLGFFEILIWLFAISQIMKNLDDPACFLAFAAGFTLGNLLGILIEKKLAMGTVIVRIITRQEPGDLIDGLRAANYGVTRVEGHGSTGPVQIILTVIKRRQLAEVVALIRTFQPRAFYSVDDLQSAAAGIFPVPRTRSSGVLPSPLRMIRSLASSSVNRAA